MKRICCFCESWESGGIESFLASVYTHADLSELEIDIVTSKLLDKLEVTEMPASSRRYPRRNTALPALSPPHWNTRRAQQ